MKNEAQILPDLIGEQCRILYLSDEKNQVVLGVAGSGKSVEAIYRAFWLSLAHPTEEILILTFNNQINKDLKGRLEAVKNKFSDLQYHENIEIETFYTYFQAMINQYRRKDDDFFKEDEPLVSITANEENEFFKKLLKKCRTDFSDSPIWNKTDADDFIKDEIDWMQKMGIHHKDQYLNINRIGRGNARISPQQRESMYDIFKFYYRERRKYFTENPDRDQKQKKKKYFNFNDIYLMVHKHCDIPEEVKPKYIIIDEVQDVTPAMFIGLQLIIKTGGLWNVFGDLSQNIFGGQISWRQLGIKTNKIYRLHHNYRNTKEIGLLAKSILDNVLAQQDNVAGVSSDYFIEPELSAFSDDRPSLCQINNNFWIEKLKNHYSNQGTSAVITLNKNDIGHVRNILENNGLEVVTDIPKISSGKVFIGNIMRIKGLEFDNVVLYGIDSPQYGIPESELENGYLGGNLDGESKIIVARNIYVAMTRARRHLILTYTKRPLPFLFTEPELIEKVD